MKMPWISRLPAARPLQIPIIANNSRVLAVFCMIFGCCGGNASPLFFDVFFRFCFSPSPRYYLPGSISRWLSRLALDALLLLHYLERPCCVAVGALSPLVNPARCYYQPLMIIYNLPWRVIYAPILTFSGCFQLPIFAQNPSKLL